MQTESCRMTGGVVSLDWVFFFSLAGQSAFDAAQVNCDSKALFHTLWQVSCAQVWFGLQGLLDKGQNIGRQLVSPTRALHFGQKPKQSGRIEPLAKLGKAHARESKSGSRRHNRLAILDDPAKHFVFDLDQVARVEKRVRLKKCIFYSLGMGVERCRPAQTFAFWIQLGMCSHLNLQTGVAGLATEPLILLSGILVGLEYAFYYLAA
jgi:hypothetical protein